MKLVYTLLLIIYSSIVTFSESNVINENGVFYFADRLVVKYKQLPNSLNKINNDLFSKLGIVENQSVYKGLKDYSKSSEELRKIYTLKFTAPYNPVYVAKEFSKMDAFEWAEPYYLYELAYDPNDPLLYDSTNSNYQMLDVIKARDAWNINKGSEDVIIAIVDTGVEWEHEDLADNMWINSDEIADNGIDDDGNGFIDDLRGWDFGGLNGTPDNDPDEDRADHGTHVAGLASAVTDNSVGIASIGFNTKIMAVKTSQDDIRNGNTALIAYGYEGVLYAADNGAKVINCSWGGYSYSYSAQAIINYAVSKGALVVAAAGNDNTTNNFYPASYDGVLSVGGTSFVDQKASWSNYGTKIDVTSPGINIYSTWLNNSYRSMQGTSMASPIAAGLAALVKAQFPEFTPLQIGEQIRINTDNIENINLGYPHQLGSGRINSQKALSNVNSKSVRITNVKLIEVGDKDEIFESGENVKITLEFTNYINPVSNLNVQMSSENNNIELINSYQYIGSMNTLEVLETNSGVFEIAIKEDAEENVDVNILVSYSGSDYIDYEWITIPINPTYQIQTTENLSVTFNSSGSIGFDDYPTNLKGKGLIYKDGPNLMFEGALVFGNSANTIVNSARDTNGDKDNDFTTLIPISQNSPGVFADKETYARFTDISASPSSLGIETEVYTYSFANGLDADYMFMRYMFNNTTNEEIINFYVGQYYDFDIDGNSYDDDMVAFDTENNFGYAFDDNGDPVTTHIGLALLSEGNTNFFAMDNTGESNPTISWDGFSDIEKWTALTSGKSYLSSGPSDISLLISGGPYTLNPDSKTEVDFLLAAADNLEELRTTIERARIIYMDLPTDINHENELTIDFILEQNYPNPFNPSTVIQYQIPANVGSARELSEVNLTIFDILGRKITTFVNKKQKPGSYKVIFNAGDYPSGVYFYKLSYGNYIETKKMLLLK